MTDDRVSTGKSRVKKISARQTSTRHRSSSLFLNPRKTSVIHIAVKSTRSARLPAENKANNNLASTTTNQSRSRLQKSASEGNSVKQLSSATRRVSVTSLHRQRSRTNPTSSENTDNSSEKSHNQTSSKASSAVKQHRSQTAKVDQQKDTNDNKSVSTNHSGKKHSLGSTEDLTNRIHKYHDLAKNKKTKNFIDYFCRCSRRRVFISLFSLIVLSIIIAIILAILLKTSKTTSTTPFPVAYLRWNASGITLFGTTSVRGNTSYQFSRPFGIAFNSFNDLYVADRTNHRIQKCRIGQSSCTTIAGQENAVRGTNMSGLSGPTFMYIDSNNNLYITDSENQRVQFWNYGASYGKTVAGVTGFSTSASNHLDLPYGITLDSTSNTLYVADCNNNRIMKYLSGASSGTVVAGGFGAGTNSSQLSCPAGIHLDSSTNSLIIANFGASNILRWVLGDNKWTLLAGDSKGLNGNISTLLDHPTDVIFDPMGNMYVADMFNHRIQLYLAGQSTAITIAGISGVIGNNSTMLYYPVTMIFDNQLNLYVTDAFNNRIQKFQRY